MPEKKHKKREFEADAQAPLPSGTQPVSDRDHDQLREKSSDRERSKKGIPRDVVQRLIDWLDQ